MVSEFQLRVLPQQAYDNFAIIKYISEEKGLDARTITHVRVLKKSIDARQRTIYVNLSVRVYINEQPSDDEYKHTFYGDVSDGQNVIVIGEGPCGLFASLRLIELGFKPIVLERGKNVHDRKTDMALITKSHKVNSESNYCFGEGGAGAYSDGKLYTRSKKRGPTDKILNVFCQHGASLSILSDAHPHIGTDKLPAVIENMRNTIIKCGGEVHFQTKMTSFIIQDNTVVGCRAFDFNDEKEKEYSGPVILATGHSARDIYMYFAEANIDIETKGLAIGVRVEHPSQLIDCIQYHNLNGRGKYLPAAEYRFVSQVAERGVYSFCMCPGGYVIPAATGPQQIVVNGMSPSNRGTAWSNSGIVVEIRPEDVNIDEDNLVFDNEKIALNEPKLKLYPVLKMMLLQQVLERECWQQGNMRQTAPAQRMTDFVKGKLSYDLPRSSYSPGLVSSPLHFWMPKPIVSRLQEGFKTFENQAHGFLTNEAVLIAIETRTSSPVRIPRDTVTLQHIRLKGLFPGGEGAGYAGGIVSAAVDGERCAEQCAEYLKLN
jgi:uncharacterized FAD-dependent dehydrogenase